MSEFSVDTSTVDKQATLTSDYTILWTREELMEWYLSMRNRVIKPPKIRRQTPKPPRNER